MKTFSSVDEPISFIGKGEENVVLFHEQLNCVIRIALTKASGQIVRRPCQDLFRDLSHIDSSHRDHHHHQLTPLILGNCKFAGKEIIRKIFDLAACENENKNNEIPEFLLGVMMECAFLKSEKQSQQRRYARFEIKPKWGYRAITKSVKIISQNQKGETSPLPLLSYSLPEVYLTQSKYFLKQQTKQSKYSKNDHEEEEEGKNRNFQLKYDPEIFFDCCVNKKDATLVAQSLFDCYQDQKMDPSRNNFSVVMDEMESSSTTLLSHLFSRGATELIETRVLEILSEYQRFGQLISKEKNIDHQFLLLEAPMMDFLIQNYDKMKSFLSKEETYFLEFEQVVDKNDSKIRIPLSDWTNKNIHDLMIRKLYNATAARDVSIVVSFSFSFIDKIDSCKVSVIDLDDKSEYRSVEEIARRDAKVYGI